MEAMGQYFEKSYKLNSSISVRQPPVIIISPTF